MINVDQEYTREVECEYKGEKYKVRDNGAVFRMAREGKTKRPKDETWTFGHRIDRGYAWFCSEAVHRIVAVAFLGNPPTKQHVVDHIDTNRQNNRPENLRWLTKLENILLNPITRKKIEYWCGSVENFLEDPSQLNGHESDDANFNWMRAVTKEEAQNALNSWKTFLGKPKLVNKNSRNAIEEWIFKNNPTYKDDFDFLADIEPIKTEEVSTPIEKTAPTLPPEPIRAEKKEPMEKNITKAEFMTALLEICKNEGWDYKKNYKAEGWNADILISIGDSRFAFSAYGSTKKAAESLPQIEHAGVKGFGLLLSPWDNKVLQLPCFCLHRFENTIEVTVSKTRLPLASFIKKAMEGKIEHLTKATITAVDVIFEEIECWHCHQPHFVFYTRYMVDETGARHHEYDPTWVDDCDIPNLRFGEEILELVKQYIANHPEKGIVMGEVKERHSKTVDDNYMSFGCPHCDSIYGEWFLNDLELALMYVTDEDRMNRIQLKTPFEISLSDWLVKE